MILALGFLLLLACVAVAASLRDTPPTADAPADIPAPAAPPGDTVDATAPVDAAPAPPLHTLVRVPLPVWDRLDPGVRACLGALAIWTIWDGHMESAPVPLESDARADLAAALATARVADWSELVFTDASAPRVSGVRASGDRTSDVTAKGGSA